MIFARKIYYFVDARLFYGHLKYEQFIMEILSGKNILVVGATGGIGSGTAKLLAGSGAKLFLAGRNAEKYPARRYCRDLGRPHRQGDQGDRGYRGRGGDRPQCAHPPVTRHDRRSARQGRAAEGSRQ